MDFIGMDTGQAREHAERLRAAAQRLGSEHAVLSSAVQASHAFWSGPDAEAFRSTWADGAGRLLHQLVGELEESASVLDGDVQEQESASAGEPTSGGRDDQGGGGRGAPAVPGARHGGGDGQVSPEVARAWSNMSEAQQQQVLQEIVNQELERQGLPPLDVHFEDLGEDGLGGYWIEFDIFQPWRGEHIVIDLEAAKDPWVVNIAAHEARHAAQDQWIEETEGPSWWQIWAEDDSAAEHERIEREHGVTPEEIDAWRENDKDYQPAPGPQPDENAPQSEHDAWNEEYEKYREQPLETDAFDTGDEFAEEITLEELQQYQQDAGVPITS